MPATASGGNVAVAAAQAPPSEVARGQPPVQGSGKWEGMMRIGAVAVAAPRSADGSRYDRGRGA